ncbi:MarR family winged helix-turn-helix transcriptional regulator [Nocardioides mangrovi]|uniref:MarR family transcriptional regulator n=1 Tax=Nocardioides mangrovi TaxID=2874580 RepID=A0ABS7U829_9ACTN|nr:MarR family transcriptional regulator [Nocardioides mangrovi]MBZ5737000.1 MarR family transcriptional regulator [Nocardioides mangrovi]
MRTTSTALLRRSVTALASRARAERGGDLSLGHVAVLGRVLVDGPLTPGEIGAQLAMTPQSLTRPLASLESHGLVRRTPDPADGRGSLIDATDAGRRAMRDEMAPRDRWLTEAVNAVCTVEEQELLARAAEVMLRVAAYGDRVVPVEP